MGRPARCVVNARRRTHVETYCTVGTAGGANLCGWGWVWRVRPHIPRAHLCAVGKRPDGDKLPAW